MMLMMLCVAAEQHSIFQPTGKYAVEVQASQASPLYVVMFTASYCGPCRTWKNSSEPKLLEAAGQKVTYVDIQQNGRFYSGSIPRFWLCRDQKQVYEWPAGGIKAADILRKIDEINSTDESRASDR